MTLEIEAKIKVESLESVARRLKAVEAHFVAEQVLVLQNHFVALDVHGHFISDLVGIGLGFRDSNAWLAVLTGNIFPAAFYAGDALGSFNSWMRLITGILFGNPGRFNGHYQ